MIRFQLVGEKALLAPFAQQLDAAGAAATMADPDLVLVGVATTAEAQQALEALPSGQWRRCLLVGLYESLEMQMRPKPGSFADVLERFRVLGALPSEAAKQWTTFGFVGPKALAPLLGAGFVKLAQTPTYASWSSLPEDNAGSFLLRLAEVASAHSEWGAKG